MTPLNHAPNGGDNNNVTGWKNCQYTTGSVVAGALLRQHALLLREHTVTASVV